MIHLKLRRSTSGSVEVGDPKRIKLTAMDLQSQFHQEMLRIYDEATEFGYYPTRFKQMVGTHGGLGAAQLLLGNDTPSRGFEQLWEEGRLDLSVEALVLRTPWAALFTESELREAERRLEGSDYDTK